MIKSDQIRRVHFIFGVLFYPPILFKTTLIVMMNFEVLASYRWLDCYLLGRLLFGGRVPESSKYGEIVLIIYLIVTRFTYRKPANDLHLSCFKFLFMDRQELESICWISEHKYHDKVTRNNSTVIRYAKKSSRCDSKSSTDNCRYFENPYDSNELILRPNRTIETWHLYQWLFKYSIPIIVMIIMSLLMLVFVFIMPSLLTSRGFGMIHKHCLDWIILDNNNYQMANVVSDNIFNWSHIIMPYDKIEPKTIANVLMRADKLKTDNTQEVAFLNESFEDIPIMLPLVNLVPINLYHIVRITFDVVENLIIFADTILTYLAGAVCIFSTSFDLLIYSNHLEILIKHFNENEQIRQRHKTANKILCQCRRANTTGAIVRFTYPYVVSHNQDISQQTINTCSTIRTSRNLQTIPSNEFKTNSLSGEHTNCVHCCKSTSRLQALVHDYFKLIDNYNKYVSLITFVQIWNWLVFTFAISIRILAPGKLEIITSITSGIKLEFINLFGSTSFYIIAIVLVESSVQSASVKLYNLIVSSIALDNNSHLTKRRWQVIIMHYYPKALCSFRLLDTSILSLLFLLKVIV